MSSSSVFKLWTHARLVTLVGDAKESPWGWVENGAMLSQGEHLLWAGDIADLDAEFRNGLAQEIDLGGAVVTPGLIDCHTHLVYGGQRAAEFEQRLAGASYEEIARAGDELISFDGGLAPPCELIGGSTRDFNLMHRRSRGQMQVKSAASTPVNWQPQGRWVGLFTASGGRLLHGGRAMNLAAMSLAWCEHPAAQACSFEGQGAAWWMTWSEKQT